MNSSIRSSLLRAFSGASVFVVIFSLLLMTVAVRRSQMIERKNQLENQSHLVGELVRPSVNLSNYGETQRLLGLMSEQGIIPAVLTTSQQLLLADYRNGTLFNEVVDAYRKTDSCERGDLNIEGINGKFILSCADLFQESNLGQAAVKIGTVFTLFPIQSYFLPPFVLIVMALTVLLALVINLFFLRGRIYQNILIPLDLVIKRLENVSKSPLDGGTLNISDSPLSELQKLNRAFMTLLESAKQAHYSKQEAEKKLVLDRQAEQVAHDIRSPLAALKVIVHQLGNISSELKALLESAVERIEDISLSLTPSTVINNSILVNPDGHASLSQKELEPFLLSAILKKSIAEKRLELADEIRINLNLTFFQNTEMRFVRISKSNLSRVFSNILNNAVEAISDSGTIDISVLAFPTGFLSISIKDSGKGISLKNLNLVGKKGFSEGKKNGRGLGLSFARAILNEAAGTVEIESEENIGTTIRLIIPIVEPPQWFAKELLLRPGFGIAILDDDPSIHLAWKAALREQDRSVSFFSSRIELERWVKEKPETRENTIFLFDYELSGDQKVGAQIATELGIEKNTYILSNKFDNSVVRADCIARGLRIAPKELINQLTFITG
jgi:signal transduction histidine kinase